MAKPASFSRLCWLVLLLRLKCIVATPKAASLFLSRHADLYRSPLSSSHHDRILLRSHQISSSPLQIRGGSTASPKTTKKSSKQSSSLKQRSSSSISQKQKKQKSIHDGSIFQLLPVSNNSVEIQAVLTDRTMSWKTLARVVLGIMAATFLQRCFETVGLPRRQAIWSYLRDAHLVGNDGNDNINSNSNSNSNSNTIPPPDFRPSNLDSFLATTLAKTVNDMIPPSAMPQGGPLVGAIATSIALVLCTVLLPHWLLSVQVWFDYQKQQQQQPQQSESPSSITILSSATAVLISVNNSNSKQEQALCKLYPTSLRAQMEHDMPPFYFEHGLRRYYFDPVTQQCWEGGPNLQITVSKLVQESQNVASKASKNSKKGSSTTTTTDKVSKFVGLLNKPSQLLHAEDRWHAYNHQTSVPVPTIVQALWGRLKSPLVVVQLIGKSMAVLEEGKGAFLSLGQTVFEHYRNARKSILASRTLQQDVAGLAKEFATTSIWIYRNAKWKQMVASDLLPGDLFLLTPPSSSSNSAESGKVIPVDALLVDGLCVTMEAVLTGESVPQTKMPLESATPEWNQTLDMAGAHRSAVLFAGTTLLHCAPTTEPKSKGKRKGKPPAGVLCLALRTGSYSSKGELISTLASSRSQSGAATISNPQFDKDALRLITSMSVVTALACASLFWKSSGGDIALPTKKVSGFRRTIQCTRIASACIPSDLPLALSSVVQSCADVLRVEADVVCSQPGALLTASQIDTVVLDKTGTITADTQSLSKIVTSLEPSLKPKRGKRNGKKAGPSKMKIAEAKQQSDFAKLVLAGCHSLVYMPNNNVVSTNDTAASELQAMVGDPLEKAALQFSGWSYYPEGGFYSPLNPGILSSVERMYVVKIFPFSPTTRLSSAICLTRTGDEYTLHAFVKGAPESVKSLVYKKGVEVPGEGSKEAKWFDQKVQRLEATGFRALAMGARELKVGNSTFSDEWANASFIMESDVVATAQAFAAGIHRSDIEGKEQSMSFCGFACFNAYTRPSSKRILRELKNANVNSIVLTGDAMQAALAVASTVGMLSGVSEIASLEMALDTTSTERPKTAQLQWRLISIGSSKKDKISKVSVTTIKRMLRQEKRGDLALAASGDAVMTLLQNNGVQGYQKLLSNLSSFTIVARASPECKETFVKGLREAGRRVLMCGDGVNDVSAMKEAEVSVALLNGFGAEKDQADGKGGDLEDARRRQRIKRKNVVGPTNELTKMKAALDQEGIGSSPAAAVSRVRQNIEKANEKITKRAAERQGIRFPVSEPIPYNLSEIKEMVYSILFAAMEERRRAAKIKQGGSAAANILAEDDAFVKAGSRGMLAEKEIKPGEACMASPFSCLRSSIDGVEAVLRAGVATAACALSVQQKITLHSLMSCFNLSALYRDGFKYGKNMWTMEFLLYMIVDQASYTESTKMRPHLPRTTRPSAQSLFDASNILSVILQAGVHLVTTEVGIRFGRSLEAATGQPSLPKLQIRPSGSQSSKMAVLMEALAKSKAIAGLVESEEDEKSNFLSRPKFTPNYETNIVFVLSVLQSTTVTLLLHKGAPFYPSILESRKLVMQAGFSVLFVVAAILETFPLMNQWLELRPWGLRRHKLLLLGLATANVLTAAVIEWICRLRFRSSLTTAPLATATDGKGGDKHGHAATAADEEEQILNEEAKRSFRVVLAFAAAIAVLSFDAAVKG